MPASPNDSSRSLRPGTSLDHDRLMREALVCAGTSFWSQGFAPDSLGGIDAAVALLGYPPGQHARTRAAWNALVHADDLRVVDAAFGRHVDGETPSCDAEYRALAHDGRWRWMAERGRIVEWWPDGSPRRMVGTLSDVTRRHAAEDELRKRDARLGEIARHVPGVLYQFRRLGDSGGYFGYVSERCTDILGFPAEELTQDASTLFDRIHPDDRQSIRASAKESATHLTPWRFDFRLQLPGRGWRWLQGTSSPQRASDGEVIWCGYMQDVTELRELEHARERGAAADAANRAKTEFLSRMSHELRTPLNAMLGFAQLLELDRESVLDAAQRRRVAIIRESGEHLLGMIGDLLDHARIEAGQLPVDLGEVALAPLLQRTVDALAPQAQAASVSIALQDIGAAVRVIADATRLRQVVFNLLGNAIKYNRAGGTVGLRVERAGTDWALRIEDSGVGIAADDQPRLFEPFDRLSHAHSGIEGAGLGLAISRSLVSLMRGRIEVTSEAAVGSTFSVFLPAADGQSTSLPT